MGSCTLCEHSSPNAPRFTLDWVQKVFEANPEKFVQAAAEKCPRLEKVYACHKACPSGDMECHHQCHGHHHHHGGSWHHEHHPDGFEHQKAVEAEPEMSRFAAMLSMALPKGFLWSKFTETLYDKAVKIVSDAYSHKFKEYRLDKEIL